MPKLAPAALVSEGIAVVLLKVLNRTKSVFTSLSLGWRATIRMVEVTDGQTPQHVEQLIKQLVQACPWIWPYLHTLTIGKV